MIRVLLYGEVDLNLIDGSAIWLASLAEVFGGMPNVSVTVLQRTRITRKTVIQAAAALSNVTFVDPWKLAAMDQGIVSALSLSPAGRLTPETAAGIITWLDQKTTFDVFLIRSIEVAVLLSELPHADQRLWVYVTDPMRHTAPAEKSKLNRIVERCHRILCQTEEAKAAMAGLLDLVLNGKVFLLPPMIPMSGSSPPVLVPQAPRLGYSGKFSPPYMILQMLDAFEQIRAQVPRAEFHVVGDKFHNVPPVPDFENIVKKRLSTTPGVFWHGGVTRAEANQILQQVHVASSWRSETLDDTVEISTKILEYSGLGIPTLMNPSQIQRRVFGPGYPGYVTTEAEFIERFLALTGLPQLYENASCWVREIARQFTFESVRSRLLPLLPQHGSRSEVVSRKPTILWAGHDLKFLRLIREIIDSSGTYCTLTDQQEGHVIKEPRKSRECLSRADLIFCEWCLGNVEWYAQHKQPSQRLVVRLHRQEIDLPFLHRIKWEVVDRIIFITPWVMDKFLSMFPFMKSRAALMFNAVDWRNMDTEKLFGAEFNLGLLGFCPKLKAPHVAFEILTQLKKIDSRYTLFLKGRQPWELDWLWRRGEERRYYEELYTRIERSPYATSIVFEAHAEDVSNWFSKIGFVLSTSDLEGSHQAVAEGMASGAIPVIRDWFGASRLYPEKYIFCENSDAVELIRKWNTSLHYQTEMISCRNWSQKFDAEQIAREYATMFAEFLLPQTNPDRGRGRGMPCERAEPAGL